MPLKESYVTWNNKGGVGKSTLTFHMATQYARRNPDKQVLVIDLCPQANVSMALLSSAKEEGNEHLASLYRQKKTVSFYLQKVNATGPVVDANEYLTRVYQYNDQLSSNVFLLCGDMTLELVGRHLEHKRSNVGVLDENPWLDVTSSIRGFIEGSEGRTTGVTEDVEGEPRREWVVFIDTNPSFSVYTEIAIAAANKLIIPINADDFSKQAVEAMLDLVYGIAPNKQPKDFAKYRKYSFSDKAKEHRLKRARIHLLVNNRTTTIFTRSAKAFKVMGDNNLGVLYRAYQQLKKNRTLCFAPRGVQIANISDFKKQYFEDVRDFHTTAILSIHTGCPLGALKTRVSLSREESLKVDHAKVDKY